jgi:hypothetical protein
MRPRRQHSKAGPKVRTTSSAASKERELSTMQPPMGAYMEVKSQADTTAQRAAIIEFLAATCYTHRRSGVDSAIVGTWEAVYVLSVY